MQYIVEKYTKSVESSSGFCVGISLFHFYQTEGLKTFLPTLLKLGIETQVVTNISISFIFTNQGTYLSISCCKIKRKKFL